MNKEGSCWLAFMRLRIIVVWESLLAPLVSFLGRFCSLSGKERSHAMIERRNESDNWM